LTDQKLTARDVSKPEENKLTHPLRKSAKTQSWAIRIQTRSKRGGKVKNEKWGRNGRQSKKETSHKRGEN